MKHKCGDITMTGLKRIVLFAMILVTDLNARFQRFNLPRFAWKCDSTEL